MEDPKRKKVLIAPLDWGLGHATRCIPVIRELTAQGVEVVIAVDGRPYDLLRKEFPSLSFIRLSGYGIKYSAGNDLQSKIVRQLPKILLRTVEEHNALRKIIREHRIDGVISDNRFGLWSRRVACVYVTHQIGIILPAQIESSSPLVYRLNKFMIERYTECWIPDYEGEQNLSGVLSHRYPLPSNASFVGPLSRFRKYDGVGREYDLLVVLSGPEPQRSILEEIVMSQLKETRISALVVRGIPEMSQRIRMSDSVSVVSSLDSDALNKAILASEVVLSRPGYSSIMDIAALGGKAIFVPTPGQTEQEYLADVLEKRGVCVVQRQENFDLKQALTDCRECHGFSTPDSPPSKLPDKIRHFLERMN